MEFDSKLRAKENIRHHYLFYFCMIAARRFAKLLLFVVPSVLLLLLRNQSAMGAMLAFIGSVFAMLAAYNAVSILTLQCVQKHLGFIAAYPSTGFRMRMLLLLKAELLVFARKLLWFVFFLAPSFLSVSVMYIMSERQLLYARHLLIFYIAGFALAALGLVFYYMMTDIYRAALYAAAAGLPSDAYCFANDEGNRLQMFRFDCSLLPWRLLCLLLPATVYAAPYLLCCRLNFMHAMVVPAETRQEIKIYMGKGLAYQKVSEV
ncbi:MAG: hypothetical protein IJ766_04170 [Clostridia bacterium]|nr:hypothetical protein [Clostridia bacterium]